MRKFWMKGGDASWCDSTTTLLPLSLPSIMCKAARWGILAFALSGCTPAGGVNYCQVLPPIAGATLGGVTGAFLAGNSVTNNIVTTKNGGKLITTVTKKNASNGTVALYTGGGAALGGIALAAASAYFCPSPTPAPAPAKGITENERLHQDDLSMR